MSARASRTFFRPRFGLFICWLLMSVSCVVIEPGDNVWKPQDGILRLWGFAPGPSGPVSVEAMNSSNGWEQVASGTTTNRITYTGTRSGYYWELAVNIDTLAPKFKFGGSVRLRAKAVQY